MGKPRNGVLLAVIALLLAVSIGVQVVRDRGWAPYQPENPLLWVQSGPLMQRLVLGYDNLVADAYWIRAVIYFGGKRRAEGRQPSFELLYPLLDLVTTLDPHFRIAYRFGAIFLAEASPSSAAGIEQAVTLLRRGIDRDFGRWEYFHDIGFIYYWWVRDYQQAAEWFLKGAEQPGAAQWLRPLAATTLATGGQRDTSRKLWTELLNSDMDFIKSQARLRLQQLDAMDVIAQLTAALQRFVDRERRYPGSWEELARAEGWRAVPTDPTGMRFVFDPKLGYVDLNRKSTLWPLPTDANRPDAKPQ
jgi:hypothetical protein